MEESVAEQTTTTIEIPSHHKIRKMGIEDLDTIIVIRDYVRTNIKTLIPKPYGKYHDWERMMDILDRKIEILSQHNEHES